MEGWRSLIHKDWSRPMAWGRRGRATKNDKICKRSWSYPLTLEVMESVVKFMVLLRFYQDQMMKGNLNRSMMLRWAMISKADCTYWIDWPFKKPASSGAAEVLNCVLPSIGKRHISPLDTWLRKHEVRYGKFSCVRFIWTCRNADTVTRKLTWGGVSFQFSEARGGDSQRSGHRWTAEHCRRVLDELVTGRCSWKYVFSDNLTVIHTSFHAEINRKEEGEAAVLGYSFGCSGTLLWREKEESGEDD